MFVGFSVNYKCSRFSTLYIHVIYKKNDVDEALYSSVAELDRSDTRHTKETKRPDYVSRLTKASSVFATRTAHLNPATLAPRTSGEDPPVPRTALRGVGIGSRTDHMDDMIADRVTGTDTHAGTGPRDPPPAFGRTRSLTISRARSFRCDVEIIAPPRRPNPPCIFAGTPFFPYAMHTRLPAVLFFRSVDTCHVKPSGEVHGLVHGWQLPRVNAAAGVPYGQVADVRPLWLI